VAVAVEGKAARSHVRLPRSAWCDGDNFWARLEPCDLRLSGGLGDGAPSLRAWAFRWHTASSPARLTRYLILILSPYETTTAGCQNRAQWATSFMCVHPRP